MKKSSLASLANGETVSLIRRLLSDQALRYWKQYTLAILCMALIAAATALSAYLMRDVINKVFLERNQTALWGLSGAVVGLYLVKGFATYGQQVTLTRISNAIVASYQSRLFRHLLQMDITFFTNRHTAEILSRQSMMAGSCGIVLNTVVLTLGRDLLSLVGLVSVMVLQDPLMSLFGLLVMPPAVWGVNKLVRRARKVMQHNVDLGIAASRLTQEAVRGMKVVKTFCLEDQMQAHLDATVHDLERTSNKLAAVGARSAPLMETLGGFAVAGVILYGGWQVVSAGQSPGIFFSFITALLLAYEPAKRLARVHVELSSNLVGVRMMYEFLETPATEAPETDKPELMVPAGRIEFRDVNFAYRADEPVLNGLTLFAEPGRTTALVGRSGGGKSTILTLLLRFYDSWEGSIAIDGVDVRDVDRRSLRAAIGYVGQDIYLFNGTIRENIAYGRPDATQDEVEAAALAAYAHDFIMQFPSGYDTHVGENGTQLSGGQRQRVAIARAILKDAPILLLDEATAALDTESERAIQIALEKLSEGRTTLVIAHRLQTIERADQICVLEQGRVVEHGRHQDLIARGGRYAALHSIQFE